jgi:3-deoxy-D-manno-octulosonic-acid transferase
MEREPMRGFRVPAWYRIAWLAALPFVALYLCWRGLRQREYLRHWGERFLGSGARTAAAPRAAVIWVHAVSVGETRAAQPLIEQLAQSHPDSHFVLTHMTPTGRAAGAELARSLPGRVQQRYLPYDLPFAVHRFLRQTRPRLGVLMETEIWPELLAAARSRRVPVVLANARLSQRSLDKALRHPDLIRGAAGCLSAVGAQSAADRSRLAQLYSGPIAVTGNLKFDLDPDAGQRERGRQLRAQLRDRLRAGAGDASGERPIWLFASTREGEERLILDAWRARQAGPRIAGVPPLLLVVPRHPQRFGEVAGLLRESGASVLRRTQWTQETPSGADAPRVILLGDSMGEMPLYYAMADVALIGGSLLPLGGQNLIEACACGCPVVLGPHMFNFAQAAADAVAAGAACPVHDAAQALEQMERIAGRAAVRGEMSAAALAFATVHRGATARTQALIEKCWNAGEPSPPLPSGDGGHRA